MLTMRYSHRRLHDLAGAVEKLPMFLPDRMPGREALRATGTDEARPLLGNDQNVLALCLALSERSERISVDSDGLKPGSSDSPQTATPLERPAETAHNSSVRRDGRAADCTGLENRQHESVRGFESLSLRFVPYRVTSTGKIWETRKNVHCYIKRMIVSGKVSSTLA